MNKEARTDWFALPCFITSLFPLSCGGRIRTCDLQVMSLASYQLLHSAIFFLAAAKVRLFFELRKYLCYFFVILLFCELFLVDFLHISKEMCTFAHSNARVQFSKAIGGHYYVNIKD